MPLVKRKVVEMAPPPKSKGNEDPDVFYLAATGEIFADYESYVSRLSFYNARLFQCELTGKVNLTFFEASESEKQEAIMLHKRFPEPLKGPVLRSVQFKITGRLDNLVDLVFDRFKDRFFANEAVFVELQGDRYYARIKEVFPPKSLLKSHQEAATAVGMAAEARPNGAVKSEDERDPMDQDASTSSVPLEEVIHRLGTDLDLGPSEANSLDDAGQYIYRIQLVDDEGSFTGSLMEASADKLSRDRLTFSKTILRKYIRDCVVREASVGAPWIVKIWLAQKYNIPTSPSDETLQKNELIKDAKLMKRKKITTDGEESSAKKKIKTAADRKRFAEEEKAKEEERLRAERRKNIKFPVEDLELDPISTRELSYQVEGELPRRKLRPTPMRGQAALPVPADLFEDFMVTYYFLIALGKPLVLSSFTLDDYEQALRHKTHEPACTLIAEIHSVLLNTIVRDGSHSKELAPAAIASRTGVSSLAREASASLAPSEDGDRTAAGPSRASSFVDELQVNDHGGSEDETIKEIFDAAKDMGKSCEKKLLKVEDGREGWEAQLTAFLAKRASVETFPRLVGILSHLTGIEHSDGYVDGQWVSETYYGVVDRYPVLDIADKIRIINFLCELAVMTKPVKVFYEECEAQVTELRKEKVEVSRERRKLAEEREGFEGTQKKEEEKEGEEGEEGEGEDPIDGELEEDGEEGDSNSEKDELESDTDEDQSMASDSGSEPVQRKLGSRQDKLRQKALQRKAEEAARAAERVKAKAVHRAKQQENKQNNTIRKRLDDEESRLWKRDEAIEREFRRMLLAPRMVPLGKDRFHERYWWFDGIGSTSLVGGGGAFLYQTGRIFVQGPSDEDWAIMESERKLEEVQGRMQTELGEEGSLGINEWAVYSEPEQVEELLSWLRVKGHRELQLKTHILKFRTYIEQGMRKRQSDLNGGWKEQQLETRRSARTKNENAGALRLSYMTWKNTAEKAK